ncbi:hypothetical protein AB6A40_000139 [Gnathostoma spinigerum]|uniref:Uncharacterized protein n=1 Tax=Gnathostoma spinigerum TaxID=75299 RepID=A0ABD6E1H0_9BILA
MWTFQVDDETVQNLRSQYAARRRHFAPVLPHFQTLLAYPNGSFTIQLPTQPGNGIQLIPAHTVRWQQNTAESSIRLPVESVPAQFDNRPVHLRPVHPILEAIRNRTASAIQKYHGMQGYKEQPRRHTSENDNRGRQIPSSRWPEIVSSVTRSSASTSDNSAGRLASNTESRTHSGVANMRPEEYDAYRHRLYEEQQRRQEEAYRRWQYEREIQQQRQRMQEEAYRRQLETQRQMQERLSELIRRNNMRNQHKWRAMWNQANQHTEPATAAPAHFANSPTVMTVPHRTNANVKSNVLSTTENRSPIDGNGNRRQLHYSTINTQHRPSGDRRVSSSYAHNYSRPKLIDSSKSEQSRETEARPGSFYTYHIVKSDNAQGQSDSNNSQSGDIHTIHTYHWTRPELGRSDSERPTTWRNTYVVHSTTTPSQTSSQTRDTPMKASGGVSSSKKMRPLHGQSVVSAVTQRYSHSPASENQGRDHLPSSARMSSSFSKKKRPLPTTQYPILVHQPDQSLESIGKSQDSSAINLTPADSEIFSRRTNRPWSKLPEKPPKKMKSTTSSGASRTTSKLISGSSLDARKSSLPSTGRKIESDFQTTAPSTTSSRISKPVHEASVGVPHAMIQPAEVEAQADLATHETHVTAEHKIEPTPGRFVEPDYSYDDSWEDGESTNRFSKSSKVLADDSFMHSKLPTSRGISKIGTPTIDVKYHQTSKTATTSTHTKSSTSRTTNQEYDDDIIDGSNKFDIEVHTAEVMGG